MTDLETQSTASKQLPPRGYASEAMYVCRWNLIEPHLALDDFTLVDWGSDAGWFSVTTAVAFPLATVISVEAGLMTHGKGVALHQQMIKDQSITNNVLINTLFAPATFDGLSAMPSDYQLVLSIFHHMGDGYGRYLTTVAEWNTVFCNLVTCANVTFLEVPNEHSDVETPHRIREWYAGRDVETTIREGLQHGGVNADLELLGETEHGVKGLRKMFKITLDKPRETALAEAVAAHIEAAGKAIRLRPYRRFKLMVFEMRHALIGRR